MNLYTSSLYLEFKCDNNEALTAPQISFEYIWGSEEYYEYVNSEFNDVFGFFLNGQNIAILPDGVTEVTINNVNYNNNTEYFRGNDVSEVNGVQYPLIEADGFTTKLIATGTPIAGEWNTIKLAIADVADRILDSYVLISANSLTCVERTDSPSKSPTAVPSAMPSASTSPTESSEPTISSGPTISVSPTTEKEGFECMIFDTKPAEELVQEILKNPDGDVLFQNVQASDHECFLHFYNGHKMGYEIGTGVQLIPEEGIIMSTGKPRDFCWNDYDDNTHQWNTDGDTNLTALLRENNPNAVSYDACTIEFEFKCADNHLNSPQVSFQYMFGSDEYYEYVDSAFNDAFAFFLNGENIALLPDGTDVAINSVNPNKNSELYFENDVSEPSGMQYIEIEADGFTKISK